MTQLKSPPTTTTAAPVSSNGSADDVAVVARLREARDRVKQEMAKVVVGQNEIVESLLIGLLCRGHVLLQGVPGLGKTLMARTLARTLEMEFRRVQFTPDLMPADITGTDVMEEDQTTGKHRVSFMPGPVFTNFLLADEINRTPPKTQADGAVISFSHRNSDPYAVAQESAMRRFNQLDMDANGYLDRDETAQNLRFVRELFDLTDTDGDGKIFADEMKQCVSAMSEPAAATCVMHVYDTGCGYFMALDANADGRVSIREMRRTSASLAQLDRDGKQGIAAREPLRHFHVEFVRGVYDLFDAGQQDSSQTPTFQARKATGPIWFQRMDRNNDGDLTWNEFLGPREVFHQLDGDADSLLDPQEAAAAR